MDDAPRVGLLEGGGHLRPDLDDPVHVERAARHQLAQVLALDVLHGDEVRPVLLADVVDVGDVRVAEGRGGARLALEALAVPLVHGQLRGQDLHGHGAVEPRVARAVDLPHAPGAQGGDDLVRPESVPGGQSQWLLRNERHWTAAFDGWETAVILSQPASIEFAYH